jgi:hypothetical protein
MDDDNQSEAERQISAIDERSMILAYLQPWSGDPADVISCFGAALRDARGASLRNVATGWADEDTWDDHSHSWLGAVGYMVLLDQLGSSIRPLRARNAGRPPEAFLRAIHDYSPEVTAAEREALYALRCCFVHDYSLVNRSGRQDRQHHFQLFATHDPILVRLPDEPWDGAPVLLADPERHARTTTHVNLRKLGDLVETIVRRAAALASQGRLEIALAGGTNEMALRYFFGLKDR